MRVSAVQLTALLSLAALGLTTAAWRRPAPSDVTAETSNRAAEVHRIRVHFDSVLTELEARGAADLTGPQQSRRAHLIATLRSYRDRGVFPHNYDFPGRTIPYFVDRKTGTLCAVGHLLESTGRRDIVDRVARTDNNVYVAQLAGDTAFTAWLAENGITVAEAARIQVPYMGDPPSGSVASASPSNAYRWGSAATIGGALFATVWNVRPNSDGHGRLANVLGATAGVAAMGLGAARVGYRDAPPALAAANVVAGAASAWVSTRGILRHRRAAVAQREATRLRETAATSIAPIVATGTSGGTGAGLVVSVRF